MTTETVEENKVDGQHIEQLEVVEPEVLDLASARKIDPPKPWSKIMFQLYGFCIIGFLCSSMNGYDGSVLGR
jgi:hypothetical protein